MYSRLCIFNHDSIPFLKFHLHWWILRSDVRNQLFYNSAIFSFVNPDFFTRLFKHSNVIYIFISLSTISTISRWKLFPALLWCLPLAPAFIASKIVNDPVLLPLLFISLLQLETSFPIITVSQLTNASTPWFPSFLSPLGKESVKKLHLRPRNDEWNFKKKGIFSATTQ